MPSKSKKQKRFMQAVKHNPKFAKKVGVPQSVGAEFVAADKRAGYFKGGGVLGSIFGRAMRQLPSMDNQAMGVPERRMFVPEKAPGSLTSTIGGVDKAMMGTGRRLGALMLRARGGKASRG